MLCLCRLRRDFDEAFQAFDRGVNHVHADAAAGNRSDFVGGGEAGLEDELQRLGFVRDARLRRW